MERERERSLSLLPSAVIRSETEEAASAAAAAAYICVSVRFVGLANYGTPFSGACVCIEYRRARLSRFMNKHRLEGIIDSERGVRCERVLVLCVLFV